MEPASREPSGQCRMKMKIVASLLASNGFGSRARNQNQYCLNRKEEQGCIDQLPPQKKDRGHTHQAQTAFESQCRKQSWPRMPV